MTAVVEGARPAQRDHDPFVQVPSSLLRSGIPSDELHVYLILCDFAGKTAVCWPSDRTIGGLIGKSQGTASRLMGRLEARGLIARQPVPKTDENPTGRVICTLVRVGKVASDLGQPCPNGRGNAPSASVAGVAPNLRQDPDSKEKKQHPAGGGVAREGAPPPAGHPDPEPPAASREEWDALDEATRDQILVAVKAANPGLAPFPKLLLPLCLVELAARAPAPRPAVPDHDAERPDGPALATGRSGVRETPAPMRPDPVRPDADSRLYVATGDVIPFAAVTGASFRPPCGTGGRANVPKSTRYG